MEKGGGLHFPPFSGGPRGKEGCLNFPPFSRGPRGKKGVCISRHSEEVHGSRGKNVCLNFPPFSGGPGGLYAAFGGGFVSVRQVLSKFSFFRRNNAGTACTHSKQWLLFVFI